MLSRSDAPQQYRQASRKGKKTWRKNVDIREIEHGLEELNNEIIQGGVVKEKNSHDLFAIDVVGDETLRNRLPTQYRKVLKADEIIAQRSAVAPVTLRKRANDGVTDGLIPAKRQRPARISHEELLRLRKVADGQHESTVSVRDATYDVWDADAPAPEHGQEFPRQSPIAVKQPKSLGRKPISLAENGNPIAAVSKPSGGYSYNPSFSEYDARLAEEEQKAVSAEEKRLAEEMARRALQEAASRSAAEAEAAEGRAELSEWDDDSEWEGFESGGDDIKSIHKRPRRKTRVQRNKIKRRKEEEQRLKHDAMIQSRNEQAGRAAQIVEEISGDEKKRDASLAPAPAGTSQDMEQDDSKLRRKRLGKIQLPEKDLELVLPDELQESLRLLKPEGNLLRDRYRNMLVRGKMEARTRITFRKKGRTKLTEKWTHKDFTLW